MLRKLIESFVGRLSEPDFKEVLNLATDDIRVNNILLSKRRTSITETIIIAGQCLITLRTEKGPQVLDTLTAQ